MSGLEGFLASIDRPPVGLSSEAEWERDSHFEHSVRQGCPLTPYLFLFFAEAMAHFLRARTTGLRGMRLPIKDDAELLDFEYANDMALYVQDDIETLERVRLSLEVFYLAVGVKINWHKSVGFLTDLGASS